MLARARLLGITVVAALLPTQTASAVAPRAGRIARPEIEATGLHKPAVPLRQHVDVQAAVPPARQRAWDDFTARTGGRWSATWDRATAVPSRLWGGSIHVPGANASPAVAEIAARGFLAQHAALLAPGVDVATLELASNHDDGRIRSIGFWQRHEGLRVVGGQISVRFLNDRLYVVSSQIVPLGDVDVQTPRRGDVADVARAATERDLGLVRSRVVTAPDAVIVPLIGEDAVLGARVAVPVEVDAGTSGRWLVYADPASGEPVLRRNLVRWAEGTLVFDVPVRQPLTGRQDYAAARANITVDGSATTTGDGGEVTWGREQAVPLVTSVLGDLVAVQHTGAAEALEATATLSISPAGTARWSAPGDEATDAQLTTFVHTQIVKRWARALVSDPRTLEFIDGAIMATVNLDDECNAFYTQGTINFFASSPTCENTGRLADVIYHEFGHGLHDHSIIEGVGSFDGAMSEGASDFVAASITDDPGMGRGFFRNDEALRHLDEVDDMGVEQERVWPDDVGEIHSTGIIFGGAFWDLRKAAIASLGEAEGIALADRLFIASLQRATDIPSALIEVLAADDDDGDLSNGTPHECLIREAFGRHGLRTVTAYVDAPGAVSGTAGATSVDVTVAVVGLSVACLGDEVANAELQWRPRERDSDTPIAGTRLLDPQPGDTFVGALTLPAPGDVVEYQVSITFTDGTSIRFPDNPGDRFYELYRGELVTLYCADFESDPFAEGWTHGTDNGGPDPWQWGPPQGVGGDAPEAFSGTGVVGMTLDGTGLYAPGADVWLRSPVIDVERYSDVRLHYRRWLGVEDGYYDKATIYANDEEAWQNTDSGQSTNATLHTRDREWVFRDVSLSEQIHDFTVQLTFDMLADGDPTMPDNSYLEFGGWTIDDVCVVADPGAICGDGVINGLEQCDQGDDNADVADACRTNCRVHACGDGILDTVEQCDDGNRAAEDGCEPDCTLPGDGDGGCCSSNDDPAGALAPIALVGLGLLVSRRRRRRA